MFSKLETKMKKTILAIAAIAVLTLVSCKETPAESSEETLVTEEVVEETTPVVEETEVLPVEEVEVDSAVVE